MPSLIVSSRFKQALWVVERIDGAGYITWEEHSQKAEYGGQPVTCLLLWTAPELAERYCVEQIKGTGRPQPVEKDNVIPFLRKIMKDTQGRVRWVILNKPPDAAADKESFRTGIAEIPVLLDYLRHGGALDGRDGRS